MPLYICAPGGDFYCTEGSNNANTLHIISCIFSVAQLECRSDNFSCSGGGCVSGRTVCDGVAQCNDNSDELNCGKCNRHLDTYVGENVVARRGRKHGNRQTDSRTKYIP